MDYTIEEARSLLGIVAAGLFDQGPMLGYRALMFADTKGELAAVCVTDYRDGSLAVLLQQVPKGYEPFELEDGVAWRQANRHEELAFVRGLPELLFQMGLQKDADELVPPAPAEEVDPDGERAPMRLELIEAMALEDYTAQAILEGVRAAGYTLPSSKLKGEISEAKRRRRDAKARDRAILEGRDEREPDAGPPARVDVDRIKEAIARDEGEEPAPAASGKPADQPRKGPASGKPDKRGSDRGQAAPKKRRPASARSNTDKRRKGGRRRG